LRQRRKFSCDRHFAASIAVKLSTLVSSSQFGIIMETFRLSDYANSL
jgi:hypothetical protein